MVGQESVTTSNRDRELALLLHERLAKLSRQLRNLTLPAGITRERGIDILQEQGGRSADFH